MNKFVHYKIIKRKISKIVQSALLLVVLSASLASVSYGAINEETGNSMSVTLIQQIKNEKVTLNLKNKTIKEILIAICKQGKVKYGIKDGVVIPDEAKYSLSVTNVSVEEALTQLLKNTNYDFRVEGDIIAVVNRLRTFPAALGQIISLNGLVVDKGKNPIAGATVLVGSTDKGAITDAKGQFRLNAKVGDELSVFFVGMQDKKYKINANDRNITIELIPSALAVDDVVVTGIFNRKVESYTGSAVTVTEKELKQYGNRNILTSLRNIDPSFNIVENNAWGSNPNRLPEVQIRGNSSLPNVDELKDDTRVGLNTPLVVLDGFEVGLQRLMDMNDNDISTITLLKDASATAIYGSRGANGVIVITTKTPVVGKLRITYRGSMNLEIPDLNSYSLMNAREKLEVEREVGRYDYVRAEGDVKLKQYYNFLLNEVNSGVDTYWLSKPLRTSVGQRHNLRIEGGDQSFRYSAAAQYNNIQGVMKGSTRNTFNGTLTLSYFYKNIKFTNNLMVGVNKAKESPYGEFETYAKMNPYFRPQDENGNFIKELGIGPDNLRYYNGSAGFGGNNIAKNPLYDATLNTINDVKSTEVTNNFSVDWTITEGLILKGRFGISQTLGEENEFYPSEHTKFNDYITDDMILRKGEYRLQNNKQYRYDGSLNLSYSKQFVEKHLIYLGVDYNIRESSKSEIEMMAEGFTNSEMNFPSMALQYREKGKPFGSESMSRSIGLTGTANYTYDNRYYVDLSVRFDGSSAFGKDKRFAPFWSSGLGWNLHNESFLKDVKGVSMIKLRGSLGITGSQDFSPYQALSTYKYYTNDRYDMWTGAYLMGLGNSSLKWQQKMNYDIGVDAKFFDNRLMLNADYYIEKTKDLISSVDIPLASGFSNYKENIGAVLNKGFEVKMTGVIVRNKNWFWSVTGAMIHNSNEITKISDALKKAQQSLEEAKGANPENLYREGYSTNSIWVVPSLGIDPSTGKEVYLDRFGKMTYLWDARDLGYCGLSEPKYQGNLNTMLKYKGFTLTMSFGYRFGGQQYNRTLIEKVENVDYNSNLDVRVSQNRWRKPGDNAFFKGLYITQATNKTSRFVQNENTIDCQNINLMYEVNSEKLRKIGIENLSLSGNIDNAFYISTVKRERGTSYPFSRQASLTLNFTF